MEALSEEGLALLKAEAVPLREEIHGRMAIEVARHVGVFRNEEAAWAIVGGVGPSNATCEVMRRIASWMALLSQSDSETAGGSATTPLDHPPVAGIECSSNDAVPAGGTISLSPIATNSEQALPPADVGSLKPDQLRAYHIVNWHLGR